MNHEAQPSGFNLVLEIIDIISLIIKFKDNGWIELSVPNFSARAAGF